MTLTCADAGRDDTVFYSATATSDATGLYTAVLTPLYWCTYDVLITMENAYTADDMAVSTTVSDALTLRVFDDTTFPSAATIEYMPTGDVDADTIVTYTIQTRSEDGRAQPDIEDVFTVTLTCADADRDNTVSISTTAIPDDSGLYIASFYPTYWCTYDVTITMTNAYTAANVDVSTIVSED